MFSRGSRCPYPLPPGCAEPSCMNFDGLPTPRFTAWLCPDCIKAAPCAFELGYARRPQLYYTNAKPWGPAKRAEWTRSTNANVLRSYLTLRRG